MTNLVIGQLLFIFAVTTVYYYIKERMRMKRTERTGGNVKGRDFV